MDKVYFWACDISKNSGEGILANLFIKNFIRKYKKTIFININSDSKNQKKDNFKIKKKNFNTIYHKYVYPYLGVLNLWLKFFQSKKTCYLNYLPLWNFLIFLLLPPRTILGPITGTIYKRRISFILNFFELISLVLINFRYKNIIFSTNFYQSKYPLTKKFENNFILNNFNFKKKLKKKKYEFVIYYRDISSNHKKYIYEIITNLKKYNYKFVVLGDKINIQGIKNFGYVSRKKAQKIISQSKFTISNPENLFSFFVQDCLSNHLFVFYNKFFTQYNSIKTKYLIPLNFDNPEKDIKIILKRVNL